MQIADEPSAFRLKAADAAAVGADPELAMVSGDDQPYDVVAEAVGVLEIRAIMGVLIAPAVEPVQSAAMRSDPEYALWVFIDRPDDRLAERVRGIRIIPIVGELFAVHVDFAGAATVGAHPKQSGAILKQRADFIMTERVRVLGDVAPDVKASVRRVEPVQSAAVCADPDKAFFVLPERIDVVVAEAMRISRIADKRLQPERTVVLPQMMQAMHCADPQGAGSIDAQRPHRVARQALPLSGRMREGGETGMKRACLISGEQV